tara:strand:+ start:172 stop:540 length:369 start_codon:yes stop_codon:yes gene_type:complete
MKKDLDEIAAIEKAIREKYGEEAVQNPKKLWNEEKEKRYLKNLREFYDKREKNRRTEDKEGFLVKDKKASNSQSRTCPVCSSYSFSSKDDLYMNKFECCFDCFVQYIEGREERWKTGWRPNN